MLYLLGRLAYFAVLGIVALVAAGPVIGVVGVLLPFALVGLLAYGGYLGVNRLLGKKKPPVEVTPDAPALVEIVKEEVVETPPPAPRRKSWLGRVIVEVIGGAVVAGAVAAAITWQSPAMAETVFAAIAAGAVVGYVVGDSRPEAVKPVSA